MSFDFSQILDLSLLLLTLPLRKMASPYEPSLSGVSTQNSDDMPVTELQYVDEGLSILRILAQLRQRVSDLEVAHCKTNPFNDEALYNIRAGQDQTKAEDADVQTS